MELRYSKSPLDTTSVFKFFVIDAQEVQTTYNSGVPSNQILWKVASLSCSLSSEKARLSLLVQLSFGFSCGRCLDMQSQSALPQIFGRLTKEPSQH